MKLKIINRSTLLIVILIFLSAIKINAQFINCFTTSINGTIIPKIDLSFAKSSSENGKYWCDYSIKNVSDEYRVLEGFKLYLGSILQFSLKEVPGSDVQITNSGFVIFYDHSKHFLGELTINVFSKNGNMVITQKFNQADMFEFSEGGDLIGVQDKENLWVFDMVANQISKYDKCERFAVSKSFLAQINNKKLKVFKEGKLKHKMEYDQDFARKLKISENDNSMAIISKNLLTKYELTNGSKIFSDQLNNNMSYKDIKFEDGELLVGIHNKTRQQSRGILKRYDLNGDLLNEKNGSSIKLVDHNSQQSLKKTILEYDEIPWPFFPFDSMRTIWNHYEQHMGYGTGDWSYLHQGLDLIVPVGEKTYSVKEGVVKSMLTLGGDAYWRIAVGDSLEKGFSDGWLYAHLVDTTIQFDVGDTVRMHDYLGDIIEWTKDWGHIHFVQIRDSGLVWYYDDNQWGINFNPLLALFPMQDTIVPQFDYLIDSEKFGFCENETDNYLSSDSLYGKIDIFIKAVDYIGDSDWQQPAYKTFYWIVNEITGDTLQGKTIGHILNHSYPFYSSDEYTQYAEVMYKRNNDFPTSSWIDKERNYYHVLTNSNGDDILSLDERNLAFNTALYPDGKYKIFAQIYDVAGNSSVDSISVQFINGNVTDLEEFDNHYFYSLNQNYPNPFNPETRIKYSISKTGFVQLKLHDILGREIKTLISEVHKPGNYEVFLDGKSLSSGVYYYTIKTKDFTKTRKMVYLK